MSVDASRTIARTRVFVCVCVCACLCVCVRARAFVWRSDGAVGPGPGRRVAGLRPPAGRSPAEPPPPPPPQSPPSPPPVREWAGGERAGGDGGDRRGAEGKNCVMTINALVGSINGWEYPSFIYSGAGALAAWASTAWSPWKGRLGAMKSVLYIPLLYIPKLAGGTRPCGITMAARSGGERTAPLPKTRRRHARARVRCPAGGSHRVPGS